MRVGGGVPAPPSGRVRIRGLLLGAVRAHHTPRTEGHGQARARRGTGTGPGMARGLAVAGTPWAWRGGYCAGVVAFVK